MDPAVKQSITNAVTSAVTAAIGTIQAKHEEEMLALREMIEKSLLLKDSASSTSPPDLNASSKLSPLADLPSKSTERWNQADLGYFDPHLDRAHGEGEIVSLGKDMYYRNVVLFVQRLQNLVIFRGAALVKANIATSLQGSALEWYTSELSDFDRDALNNDPGVKSWVNTLSHRFKMPTSVALGLLTDETYTLDDARARRPPAQYVRAIMRHGIGCNIVDVANQLSFAYRGLAPEFLVFVSPPTKSTRVADFIRALEEKQEVWHEMMTTPTTSHRYYNPTRRPLPSPYRLPLPSQSKVFSRYQSQQRVPQAQLSWQGPERSTGLTHAAPVPAPQRPYTQQPFPQTFMPQRQHYPTSDQRYQQALLPTSANRDSALRVGQNNLSPPFNSDAPDNPTNRSAPRQPDVSYQPASRQPYQSNPSYRGYQRRNEKGVCQVDDEEFDPHLEGFYTALEQEAEEVQYLDEGFDEVDANFVGIETFCGKCGTPFSSKSRLHKHLKDGCTSSVHPSLPNAPAPTSPIPIIISKSMASAMESGLAF